VKLYSYFFIWLIFGLLGPLTPKAGAHVSGAVAPLPAGVGLDPAPGKSVPGNLRFLDENGQKVTLKELTEGKPTLLALVYFGCPNLCTLILNGMVAGLRNVALTPGLDFNIVVVSIDPREGPHLAKQKKAKLLAAYGRSGTAAGWHFLTSQDQAARRLADAIGYRYTYDAARNEYQHPAALTVLTPAGKVSHYLYGVAFKARDLRLSLVEASANRLGGIADGFLLCCYHYDAATGKYAATIPSLTRTLGAACILGLVLLLASMSRRRMRSSDVAGNRILAKEE